MVHSILNPVVVRPLRHNTPERKGAATGDAELRSTPWMCFFALHSAMPMARAMPTFYVHRYGFPPLCRKLLVSFIGRNPVFELAAPLLDNQTDNGTRPPVAAHWRGCCSRRRRSPANEKRQERRDPD